MPDYLEVGYNSTGDLPDYYAYGTPLFIRGNLGAWRIGYNASESYNMRCGVYYDTTYHIVILCNVANNATVKLMSPSFTETASVTGITQHGSYYYSEIVYDPPSQATWAVEVFSSLQETLNAIKFPSPSDGVWVTVVATPNEPEPVEGVVVTVVAQLVDPNDQGGTSDEGGGEGTFDDTSDNVLTPSLPSISAVNCGFVSLFKPTERQLKDLGAYLWTHVDDIIDNLKKWFSNPMDTFIAFNIFPCNPETGTPRNIQLGVFDTNISMSPVTSQWFTHDCGVVNIREYWGSALDYSPNTKVSCMLPFIGNVTLNTDEVMGHTIGIKYNIDLLSGSCVAMITVDGNVYYQYTGECAVAIPLTGSDWSRIYSAVVGAVGTAITGGVAAAASGSAAGGATAALAGAQAAESAANAGLAYSMINDTSKGVRGVQQMRENMLQASQMALQAGHSAASAPARVSSGIRASRIANTINNTVSQVISGKAQIQHSGSISGSAGMLGIRTPYLIIEYPNQSLAENYKHFVGYPSNLSGKLNEFSGYTEVEQCVLENFWGTDEEYSELLESLKGGVYL